MPRKLHVDRPVQCCIYIPTSLKAELDLLLWSDVEGRIPQGEFSKFFSDRLKEFLELRKAAKQTNLEK